MTHRSRPPETGSVSIELDVPFHDVDALAIVWHGHYYKYFEHARTALMRSRRLDMSDLAELGYGLLVADSSCRHSAPLRYGERFVATAWFERVDRSIRVAYELTRLVGGERVARGETTLVTTSQPSGDMLFEIPEVIRARIFS